MSGFLKGVEKSEKLRFPQHQDTPDRDRVQPFLQQSSGICLLGACVVIACRNSMRHSR